MDSDTAERRGSASTERMGSVSTNRKASVSSERKASVSTDRKTSVSTERKASVSTKSVSQPSAHSGRTSVDTPVSATTIPPWETFQPSELASVRDELGRTLLGQVVDISFDGQQSSTPLHLYNGDDVPTAFENLCEHQDGFARIFDVYQRSQEGKHINALVDHFRARYPRVSLALRLDEKYQAIAGRNDLSTVADQCCGIGRGRWVFASTSQNRDEESYEPVKMNSWMYCSSRFDGKLVGMLQCYT